MTGLKVGLTGASGFVGSELARRLHASNSTVVGFSRSPDRLSGCHETRKFSTDAPPDLTGLDAVVHLVRDRDGRRRVREVGVPVRDATGLVTIVTAMRFEEGSSGRAVRGPPASQLALHSQKLLHHLVHRGDHAGVRLKTPLRHDHLGELVTDVHVRLLQEPRVDRTPAAGSRLANHCEARVVGIPL